MDINKKTTACILGKFYPMHIGHKNMIEKASEKYDEVLVFACWTAGETISIDIRAHWVKDALKELSNVKVLTITEPLGSSSDGRTSDPNVSAVWAKWLIKKYPMITHFVGSEQYVQMMADSVHIDYEIFDMNREQINISATKIRKDFHKYKHLLASPLIEEEYVFRIAVVGLDSCGKSSLVHYLSTVLDCEVVNEYGRDYCALLASPDDGVDTFINRYDLEQIAYGHNKLVIASVRNAWKKKKKIVLVDTEAIVTQGFSHRYFGENNKTIQDMINYQHYDLYLYCDLLPLEDDGTRRLVGQQERIENSLKLFELFKENVKDGHIYTLGADWDSRRRDALEIITRMVGGVQHEDQLSCPECNSINITHTNWIDKKDGIYLSRISMFRAWDRGYSWIKH